MNYIEMSKLYFESLYDIYNNSRSLEFPYSFEEIINDTLVRSEYLNFLCENISKLPEKAFTDFLQGFDFYMRFEFGDYQKEYTVNDKFLRDRDSNAALPSGTEIKNLFLMISNIYRNYKKYYEGKEFTILSPDRTFNQNITRKVSIEKRQLAHLMGLTESFVLDMDDVKEKWKKFHDSGSIDDYTKYTLSWLGKKPNLLLRHFIKYDKELHPELYTLDEHGIDKLKNGNVSERLLDFIVSKDGQNEILRVYQELVDFATLDKKKNPGRYDKNGVKPKQIDSFTKDYYDYIYEKYYKDETLTEELKDRMRVDFPILKFSRYITHTYNLANFINMKNVYSCILDYNAPDVLEDFYIDVQNKKDEFLELYSLFYDIRELKNEIEVKLNVIHKCGNRSELLLLRDGIEKIVLSALEKVNDNETYIKGKNFIYSVNKYIDSKELYFDEKDNIQKDLFLVNTDYKHTKKELFDFEEFKREFIKYFRMYMEDNKNAEAIKYFIALDYPIKKSQPMVLINYLNYLDSKKYVEDLGINPPDADVDTFFKNVFKKYYKNNVHLLGIQSNIQRQIDIDAAAEYSTHIDTSMQVSTLDLTIKYNKHGRIFFINQVGDPSSTVYRLASLFDEIEYLRYTKADKKRLSKLERNKRKLVKHSKSLEIKEDKDNLKNKYIKIVNLIHKAIENQEIFREGDNYLIYQNDKLLITFDRETFSLLGEFEMYYMYSTIIIDYINSFGKKL